ncbi:hypothetical protein F4818DRAFT_57012 [Hypoxylon cercidicola]|nr:hypothetical protein F4818DRAFT_57012 [Hypoxylon cercidicola]
MHMPRSVAALLPSTLLPLLLLPTSLGASAADRSACVRSGADDLAAAAACGDKGALKYCFEHAAQYVEAGDLERCFHGSGCTSAEAAIEAAFILHNCDSVKSVAELRRRGPEPVAAETQVQARQDTTTTTAAKGGFTPSIQCSTETTIPTSSCPVQSTGTASGRTITCFPSTATTSVCAAANICMKDSQGIDTCMLRSDKLDTGEIIVTIILAVCFATGFATLVFLCCRDKRAVRKMRARAEAAAIAKSNAANATSASHGPNVPYAAAAPAAAPGESAHAPYDPPKRAPSPGVGGGANPFDDGPRF